MYSFLVEYFSFVHFHATWPLKHYIPCTSKLLAHIIPYTASNQSPCLSPIKSCSWNSSLPNSNLNLDHKPKLFHIPFCDLSHLFPDIAPIFICNLSWYKVPFLAAIGFALPAPGSPRSSRYHHQFCGSCLFQLHWLRPYWVTWLLRSKSRIDNRSAAWERQQSRSQIFRPYRLLLGIQLRICCKKI